MFLQDHVELVADVRGAHVLRHVVHVSAHRATARARPVATAGPEDDDPCVHDFPVEQVLLRPRGDVFPRVELARTSFLLYDLLKPHGPASNVAARENLCRLSVDRARPTGPGWRRARRTRRRRTGDRTRGLE